MNRLLFEKFTWRLRIHYSPFAIQVWLTLIILHLWDAVLFSVLKGQILNINTNKCGSYSFSILSLIAGEHFTDSGRRCLPDFSSSLSYAPKNS